MLEFLQRKYFIGAELPGRTRSSTDLTYSHVMDITHPTHCHSVYSFSQASQKPILTLKIFPPLLIIWQWLHLHPSIIWPPKKKATNKSLTQCYVWQPNQTFHRGGLKGIKGTKMNCWWRGLLWLTAGKLKKLQKSKKRKRKRKKCSCSSVKVLKKRTALDSCLQILHQGKQCFKDKQESSSYLRQLHYKIIFNKQSEQREGMLLQRSPQGILWLPSKVIRRLHTGDQTAILLASGDRV